MDHIAPGLVICLFALILISWPSSALLAGQLYFLGSLANWLLAHKEVHRQEIEELKEGRSQDIFPPCFG